MDTGAWVLVIAVLSALGFGLWRAVRDGRFRGTHQVKGADALPIAAEQPEGSLARVVETLGERATLVQFSSAFCAPCRAARVVLSDVAATVPGVRLRSWSTDLVWIWLTRLSVTPSTSPI